MPDSARTIFELAAGGLAESDLRVHRFSGDEAVSEPFRFDVEFEPGSGEPIELSDLVSSDALLTMRRGDGSTERFVHGVVEAAALTGVYAGVPTYRVRIAPKLALLSRRRDCRIFQRLSVPDVVAQVLDAGGVARRMDLSGSYPPREYCVQYRETDLEFVSRLLEEEGIFYFFEHASGSHTMVIADAPGAFADVPGDPAVPFRPPQGAVDDPAEEHLTSISRGARPRLAKATRRDFDFRSPAVDLTESVSAQDGDGEWYEYALACADLGAVRRLAQARLDEHRFGTEVEAEGTCLRFFAGGAFEVTEHPDPAFDERLALIRVHHKAQQVTDAGGASGVAHSYRNRFLAIPAATAFRPARRTRKPVIAGAQTATVVGPASEEIHTDGHGRIKVHFHWDRQGQPDDTASCFVRVSQAWAGPGFGASYVPRIGQEVLVRFLDGDPDRPLVVGALYNGANPPAVQLPDLKTQSTLRSATSPGSGGTNELRFEDQAGSEQVHVHAQKDETIGVENEKVQRVGAKEALEVGANRRIEVQGDQRLTVEKSDASLVETSQTLTVTGARSTTTGGDHVEKVAAAQNRTVGGKHSLTVLEASAEIVGAAALLNVGAAYVVNVGAAANTAVGGLRSVQVGGLRAEIVGAMKSESVGKNDDQTVGGDLVIDVGKALVLGVGKDLTEQVGGKTEMGTPGAASCASKKFQFEGVSEIALVVADKPLVGMKAAGATFAANNITLEASATMTLKGAQVKKDSGGGPSSLRVTTTQLDPLEGEAASVDVELVDQRGDPVANELVRVEFSDGTTKDAYLDGAGKARIPGPKQGRVKVTLPRRHKTTWRVR